MPHSSVSRGGRVVVAVRKPLARVLASCPGIEIGDSRRSAVAGFRSLHTGDEPAPRLRNDSANVPAQVPYLAADLDLSAVG